MKLWKLSPWITLLMVTLALPSNTFAQSAAALAKGKLVVASKNLLDPNFSRTVVLLLDYGESGALGVVLNRPSHVRLEELLPDHEWASRARESIYVGGPVAVTQAMMIFTTGEQHEDQMQVLGTVHAGWNLELLERMLTEPRSKDRLRLYAGYAGWAPGQLDAEVTQRGWHVFPASEAMIFSEAEDELWQTFIDKTRTRIASAAPETRLND